MASGDALCKTFGRVQARKVCARRSPVTSVIHVLFPVFALVRSLVGGLP